MNRLKVRFKLITLLSILVISCEDGFEELNENPNANTAADASYILPYALEEALGTIDWSLEFSKIYVQHMSQLLYASTGQYIYNPESADGEWNTFYSTVLENLTQIEYQAIANSKPNREAVALILKSWLFHIMTDLWGDIPYSEANMGNPPSGDKNVSPKYDTQQSIYAGLISALDTAIGKIDVSGNPFGGADLIYGGDMSKWKKFAGSLKLRVYMRMSEVDPGTAETGIKSVFSSGNYFSSNDDSALKPYLDYPNNHPSNEMNRLREDDKISTTVLDTLKALNDPRLRVYAAPNGQKSEYWGLPPSLAQGAGYTNSGVSPIGAYFLAPRQPGVIMTYSEVQFILCEAAARGWISGSAETFYNEAIRANMNMYTQDKLDAVLGTFAGDPAYNVINLKSSEFPTGITTAEIDAYLAQSAVAWDASKWREKIGLQKWLKLYRQGVQGWFEWRRLDYPEIKPGRDAILTEVPRRWAYPLIEQSLNGANYTEAVSRMGGDDLLTKMWIDK